jgi:hypothetical protein
VVGAELCLTVGGGGVVAARGRRSAIPVRGSGVGDLPACAGVEELGSRVRRGKMQPAARARAPNNMQPTRARGWPRPRIAPGGRKSPLAATRFGMETGVGNTDEGERYRSHM